MLTKNKLLDLMCGLAADIEKAQDRIANLEKEVYKPKPIKRGTNTDGVKRKPGRPSKKQ